MRFNVSILNGKAVVTDADTNKPLDWVHVIDIITAPDGQPILYLGTTEFGATVTAGPPPPVVPAQPAP